MEFEEIMQWSVKGVKDGSSNALSMLVELRRYLELLENAISEIHPHAVKEADKYPENTIHAFGAIIEKRNGPSTWDYSQCQAYADCKKRLKYIEQIAQAGGGADSDSGEIIDKAFKVQGKATIAIKLI